MTPLLLRGTELPVHARTIIVGILNTAPDSFYDGGKYTGLDKAIIHCERMIEDGCDIIDVGGESTRPGSKPVSYEEERNRVIPVIREIKKKFNVIVSVDTTKNKIAKEALEDGVDMINDISGLMFDPEISRTVSEYKAGIVLSHTTSRPVEMQSKTYYNNLMDDICNYLNNSVKLAEQSGINRNSIIVDPGFGFGKEVHHNLLLLKKLSMLSKLNKPIMVGTSMKSFIGTFTGSMDINERHEGTIASITIAVINGASLVRVHNVKEVKRAINLVDAVKYLN